MSAALAVRTMRAGDRNVAAQLHACCFNAPWDQAWSAEAFGRLLATPGCFGLLLLADSAPAGLTLARIAADEAEILTLGVVPTWRGQGAGAALLSALVRRCRRRGVRRLFLEVAEDNVPAHRLYEAHGFIEAGRREKYFDRGAHGRIAAHIMRRDL